MTPSPATEPTAADLGFEPITTHTATAFGLLRVTALLTDELERELQDSSGIGLSELLVLIQLMLAGGRLKMAELASSLVVTRSGVTKIIDRLVEMGLVERVPSTTDRRVMYAEVTGSAKAAVREHQPVFDEIARRRLAELLDAEELDQLALLIDRLNCENPGWEPPEAVLPQPAS